MTRKSLRTPDPLSHSCGKGLGMRLRKEHLALMHHGRRWQSTVQCKDGAKYWIQSLSLSGLLPTKRCIYWFLMIHSQKYQYPSLYVPHHTLTLPFDQEQDLSVHLCSSQDFLCHQPPPKPAGFTGLWNIHLVALVLPCR